MHQKEVGTCRGEAADAWSVGAMAFLLLCGYPPFFGPTRQSISSRLEKGEYSFDPPFWSKISEDAKDFVKRCLRVRASARMPVIDALSHPWIQSLAASSPSGSMLSSFALNMRRFYRTSVVEAFTANSLALALSFSEIRGFLVKCHEKDENGFGFFTVTELKQVLKELGYMGIAAEITQCGSRLLRYPGQSYIDYVAVLDSARARRERIFEDELWRAMCEFSWEVGSSADPEVMSDGQLPLDRLRDFLQMPEVLQALAHDGVEDCAGIAEALQQHAHPGVTNAAPPKVDFGQLSSEVFQRFPPWPVPLPQPRRDAASKLTEIRESSPSVSALLRDLKQTLAAEEGWVHEGDLGAPL